MYHKWQSYEVWFLRHGAWQTDFYSFWTIFCTFTLLTTQKSKFLKYEKCLEVLSLYKHVYHKWKSYIVLFLKAQRTKFFCHIGPFFALFPLFSPSNNLENQNFECIKTPRYIIILRRCTINDNHLMYSSWDMKRDRQNFFSFSAIWCLFTPLTTQEIKILKKWNKDLEILSVSTSVPKVMTISYTVSEIWRVTD